ncbi:MAG: radical SAM protein [Deltaproteobacteria bacterium]|jgi:uncharacterized radical SAM superfamily Fe-S cluster-containing enzyme|nr:radical SAM protein [Deltaproteobacteria bacterium]
MAGAKFYSQTTSWCPECRQKVPARIVSADSRVWLEKVCGRHGVDRVLVSEDVPGYERRLAHTRPGLAPLSRFNPGFAGCPESCGLCPEHRQHTCLPVAEITSRCDLGCPVCLKTDGDVYEMTPGEFRRALSRLREYEGEVMLLNLSGGEPTLHPEFGKFVNIARSAGVAQLTVSTNGLRLLNDPALRELFVRGNVVAALQFDGLDDEIYLKLRGRKLLEEKLRLVEIFEAEKLPYSLVAVAARGVNDHALADLADFFFQSEALSLMFQPVALTGRAGSGGAFRTDNRLTLDRAVAEIEKSKHMAPGDMAPIACSHPGCAASAYYFKIGPNRFLSLKDFLGFPQYQKVTSNRSFPGLDLEGHQVIKDRIYESWSSLTSSPGDKEVRARIREFFKSLEGREFTPEQAFETGRDSVKSVFVHGLMDPLSFDFDRLVKCCNHYLQAGGRLVPMCAHNLAKHPGPPA